MRNVETSAPSVHIQTNFSAIPLELQELDQWVCWKLEERDGKPTKVPYQPNGRKAAANKPATWSTYDQVSEADGFSGIGFVFSENDPYTGVDLDGCVADGALTEFAASVVRRLASYTEFSQSGRGIHIICRGELPAAVKTDRIEMYDRGRFFVVTGAQPQGAHDTIEDAAAGLAELFKAHKSNGNGHAPEAVASLELGFELTTEANPDSLKLMALIENDAKFKKSWQHKRQDLKDTSNSAYDLSLCSVAAMAGWPDAELYALMVAHRKQYGGVEKCLREDYVRTVLAKVRTMRTDVELVEQAALQAKGDDLGAFGAISERLGVNVEALIQYGKADAVYYLTVDGEEIRVGTVADLMSYRVVKNRLAESHGIMLPTMKGYQWEQIVEMMLPLITHLEADEETRIISVISVIQRFIEESSPAPMTTKEGANGRWAFQKDGFVCFELHKCAAYADAMGNGRYSEVELARAAKALRFERHRTSYKDEGSSKHVRLWRRHLKGGST